MEILVAILIIALLAAVAFIAMQRRSGGARGLDRPRTQPIARRDRGIPRDDPMAAAVVEHAQAMDPQDVVVAEQRLQAQARQVAAGMQAQANRAEHQRAADQMAQGGTYATDPRMDGTADPAVAGSNPNDIYPATSPAYADPDPRIDPATGARTDVYGDPAADPRYDDPRQADPADPRYDDPRQADPADPRYDDRGRRV